MKPLKLLFSLIKFTVWTALIGSTLFGLVLCALAIVIVPTLPTPDYLKEVQLQTPLRIYTRDGNLIAEFGEKRRKPLIYDQIPQNFIYAILAAEDKNFFTHIGVDPNGLARATKELLLAGEKKTGGSTITMQVARNFFLTREQTFIRKFNEIFLSLQIERAISKRKIMELYVNKIYLGHRSYGIAAAAQVYYDKEISELNLAQLAMIAGLPKAPSSYNPITNPQRALIRRDWILKRMAELGHITQAEQQEATQQPITARYHGLKSEIDAPYLAEMVRQKLLSQYGAEIYSRGLFVTTTISSQNQIAANNAVKAGILEYEERHGYRGPENHINLKVEDIPTEESEAISYISNLLLDYNSVGSLEPAVVLSIEEDTAKIGLKKGEQALLSFEEMDWAKPYITVNRTGPSPKVVSDVLNIGDIIRVREVERSITEPATSENSANPKEVETVIKRWRLAHIPEAQAALVSLNPTNGALEAIVGGFDFYQSKFNRAIQAGRQPGSNFKPFIYTAALANAYTAASTINDAPIVLDDPSLETHWRPQNSSGKFYGPTRLRQALYKSRNLVSIRLLRRLGVSYTLDYVTRFGFDKSKLPRNLSLALGSASLTPMEIATGYAVFANSGFKIEPYFIDSIKDAEGNILFKANPMIACRECPDESAELSSTTDSLELTESGAPEQSSSFAQEAYTSEDKGHIRLAPRVEDERVIYIVRDIMQDVIKKGTGRRALALKRGDIAGKTGTTNDQIDAWFSGYNGDLVATAWLGFDNPSSLGAREYGAKAALPIWMHYMKVALAEKPETVYPVPPNMITVKIDPKTGAAALPTNKDAINEIFRIEQAPELNDSGDPSLQDPYLNEGDEPLNSLEELF